MLPRWHILSGFVLAYIFVYFFNYSFFLGLIIFLSSVLIDLDHIIVFFFEEKSLHPKKFFRWHDKKEVFIKNCLANGEQIIFPHFILHGVELIILLLILSIFFSYFWFVLIGVFLHLVLDIIDLIIRKWHLSYKVSQIWLWQRNKNKLRVKRA